MQYMLLIYDDESTFEQMPAAETDAILAAYGAFTQELHDRGAYRSSGRLQPTAAATAVRIPNDEQIVTDGPFAETKEQLGGYYLIEAESLDEALAWAAKVPSARYGTVEVRPIWPAPVPATA
jgi:hypothetical protein